MKYANDLKMNVGLAIFSECRLRDEWKIQNSELIFQNGLKILERKDKKLNI